MSVSNVFHMSAPVQLTDLKTHLRNNQRCILLMFNYFNKQNLSHNNQHYSNKSLQYHVLNVTSQMVERCILGRNDKTQ